MNVTLGQEHKKDCRSDMNTLEQQFNVGKRLRNLRSRARLSQRELANRAAVPHGQISMIEQNKSSPSVATLRNILSGFPMTMSDFFEPDQPEISKIFFTPAELLDLTSQLFSHGQATESGRITLRQVGDAKAHNLQMLHEHYDAGADTGDTMLEHLSHEAGIVISGEIEVTVDGLVSILKAGDAYIFDSRRPHRFRNISDRPAEVISSCTPPYL